MKRITIEHAIVNLIEETDPVVGKNIPLLIKWAKRLEERIGTPKGYKLKAVLVTAVGNVISLPEDCIMVHKIFRGDHTGEMEKYYRDYTSNIVQETVIPYDTGEQEFSWTKLETIVFVPPIWDDWGDEINLMSDYDGLEFTLWYSCIELDGFGYPIVNESHIEAIKLHLKFKIAERRLWSRFYSNRMLRKNEQTYVKDLRSDYKNEVRNARALDSQESEYERNTY